MSAEPEDRSAVEVRFASVRNGLDLDPELKEALVRLADKDREALLLVAWEDLTPSLAAACLGISPAVFRVRLHRARRRLINALGERGPGQQPIDLPPTRLELS